MALTKVSRGLLSTSIVDNGNATAITIDANENVGIGTSSPESVLAIKGSSGAADLFSISDVGVPTSGAEYGVAMIKSNAAEFALNITSYNANGKGLRVYNNGGQDAFLVTQAGGDRFVVDGSGNVGIGTSSPASSTGYTVLTLNNATNGGNLQFHHNGTYKGVIYNSSSQFRIEAGASTPMVFANPNGEAMRIDSSGTLLVGATSAPAARKFYVESQTYPCQLRMGTSAVNYPVLQLRSGYVTGGQTGTQIDFRDGADNSVGTITSTVSATSYNTSSDQRLKENIVDAPSASDDIDAIQVRSFDWKVDGSHQKYGMIAQELQSVAPEAVSGDADSDEMMGVDYSKLVPMLVKEIQSLRARITQLENN